MPAPFSAWHGFRGRGGLVLLLLSLGLRSMVGPALASAEGEHEQFTTLLAKHVKEGRVDYAALQAGPAPLDRYLDFLASVPKSEFSQWDQPRRLAFLINAYNAWTLRLIVDHYPVGGIKEIGSLLRGPWDRPLVRLFGETLTLNKLEHGIIRPEYAEPRIHFALVCAAKSCPILRSEAYTGPRLEAQLLDQTRHFLATPSKNRVDSQARVVHLSPIFKWYGGDFEVSGGSVLAFLKPHWPGGSGPVEGDGYTVRYTEYDWSLNGIE